MRKSLIHTILALVLLLICSQAKAQIEDIAFAADTTSSTDTLSAYIPMTYSSLMDSLSGSITTPDMLDIAMQEQVEKNKLRKTTGYRVRIYFDNSRDARSISEQIAEDFKARYPDIPVFRIYDNPYFKVTVGEFLSKADAMRFMETIKPDYPTVFLVKESFSTI